MRRIFQCWGIHEVLIARKLNQKGERFGFVRLEYKINGAGKGGKHNTRRR